MSARILAGGEIAEAIKSEVANEVSRLSEQLGFRPCLAVVRVGDDPASAVYVGNKVRSSEAVGILSEHHHLPETTTEQELLEIVGSLNLRDDVDGILVQLPLPKQIDERRVLE